MDKPALHAMQPEHTQVDDLSIRYARAERSGSPVLVALCPFPASILAFERVWEPLADRYDLLAIDLPGYGGSEGRPELMTVGAQAAFLPVLFEHFGVNRPYVLGPDVGMPITLFAAPENPELFASLVIGDAGCIHPPKVHRELSMIIQSPAFRSFVSSVPWFFMWRTMHIGYKFTRPSSSALADYKRSYRTRRRLRATFEFLASYQTYLPLITERAPQIETPILLLHGADDKLVPLDESRRLDAILKNSRLQPVEGASHFLYEEAPQACVEAINAWIDEQENR